MSPHGQEQENGGVLPYHKDAQVEEVLGKLNEVLYPLERELISEFEAPQHPVILIAGPPRSGTTLIMQLLIACFKIGYVSNLMARFWKDPYIGALLARELRQRKKREEHDFDSELGATYGYEGPHEFGFFWQRWFPYHETHQPRPEDLRTIDFELLRRELAAMESVFDAPLVFKNPIVFSLNIDKLAEVLPTALFVICRRDPLYTAQSLLLAREKYHGNRESWFSTKPEQYPELKHRPYPEQIAGQIYYTERRIEECLADLDPNRHVTIQYERLCDDPAGELERIGAMVKRSGHELARTGYRPERFENTNEQRVEDDEFKRLREACERFYS